MNKTILLISFCMLLIVVSGCYTKQCREFHWEDVCIKYEPAEIPCLSHIIIHIPDNYTNETEITYPLKMNSDELCYDFTEDPDNLKEEVDKLFEEHPYDWKDYIDWTATEGDVKVLVVAENITEMYEERIFNNTRIVKNCIETEQRMVCVR